MSRNNSRISAVLGEGFRGRATILSRRGVTIVNRVIRPVFTAAFLKIPERNPEEGAGILSHSLLSFKDEKPPDLLFRHELKTTVERKRIKRGMRYAITCLLSPRIETHRPRMSGTGLRPSRVSFRLTGNRCGLISDGLLSS